jgi:hypothetical protein
VKDAETLLHLYNVYSQIRLKLLYGRLSRLKPHHKIERKETFVDNYKIGKTIYRKGVVPLDMEMN